MRRRVSRVLPGLAAVLLAAWSSSAVAQGGQVVKLGFAKCAHCMPMALTPGLAQGVTIEATGFNSGSDVLTALVSKSIDVAQVTYLHFVAALDKGFDVVAISGQVNGGSECLAAPKLNLAADDWAGFKRLVAEGKTGDAPLKIAASRGSAQDIHMRGAFLKQGIDTNKDIQFMNIPNPSDHLAAIQRGEIDMVCTVEPFASQIRLAGAANRFVLPYDQAAGKLTNLIVTRSDVIAARPADVQATVSAIIALVEKLKNDKVVWVEVIGKYTGLDRKVAETALENAFPDYAMHRAPTLAIAAMMRDLKYISRDVRADIEKKLDYTFLEAATKRAKNELGY